MSNNESSTIGQSNVVNLKGEGDIGLTGSANLSVITAQEQVQGIITEIEDIQKRVSSDTLVINFFFWAMIIVGGVSLAFGIFTVGFSSSIGYGIAILVFVLGMIIMLMGYVTRSSRKSDIAALERRRQNILRLTGAASTNEKPSYFDELVRINVDNLSAYYSLVKKQTDKSFFISLGAGIVGFGLIIAGMILGFANGADTRNLDYIAIASGVITEVIASVFFYLYNKTVIQLKEYHDSLLIVQNILLAFKLMEDIEKEEIKTEMLSLVLSGLVGKHSTYDDKPTKDVGKLRNVS